MLRLLMVLAVGVLVPRQTPSPDKTAVMVPIRQFVDAFNKGEVKKALAACADQTDIIDEFPPHVWHGAGACGQWANDYDADAKKNAVTDGLVTLHAPKHIDITADRAYVVVPADYTFKKDGKSVREIGSLLTVVLQKGPSGWRMTAWSWTKR